MGLENALMGAGTGISPESRSCVSSEWELNKSFFVELNQRTLWNSLKMEAFWTGWDIPSKSNKLFIRNEGKFSIYERDTFTLQSIKKEKIGNCGSYTSSGNFIIVSNQEYFLFCCCISCEVFRDRTFSIIFPDSQVDWA